MTDLAREGKATPTVLGAAAIINRPELAIVGGGRIINRLAAGGELAVRKVTELTLTFDHIVCDGGTAAGFRRVRCRRDGIPGISVSRHVILR
ncbi:2-oxo acid dehydrogenase subunit E2 [Pseudarthrobacter sp. SSS035]|uniref:2-oxo acid dehydrogenase subunit E2 n=1 Tax=Pseudarthrobacter sp. SSS035 TaxID=2931399 RepID=UPI0035309B7F